MATLEQQRSAILAELAYLDNQPPARTIGELIERVSVGSDTRNNQINQKLYNAIKSDPYLSGMKILDFRNDGSMQAWAFFDESGKITLTFRGTELGRDFGDLLTDAQIGTSLLGGTADQARAVEKWIIEVLPGKIAAREKVDGIRLSYDRIVGHSLGGWLAKIAAILIPRIRACYAFNAPGLSYQQINKILGRRGINKDEALRRSTCIISLSHRRDIVGNLIPGDLDGDRRYIGSKGIPGDFHSLGFFYSAESINAFPENVKARNVLLKASIGKKAVVESSVTKSPQTLLSEAVDLIRKANIEIDSCADDIALLKRTVKGMATAGTKLTTNPVDDLLVALAANPLLDWIIGKAPKKVSNTTINQILNCKSYLTIVSNSYSNALTQSKAEIDRLRS